MRKIIGPKGKINHSRKAKEKEKNLRSSESRIAAEGIPTSVPWLGRTRKKNLRSGGGGEMQDF